MLSFGSGGLSKYCLGEMKKKWRLKKMENAYRTKDLAEASFLYASHQKLIRLEEDNNGRYWFIFGDKGQCEELVNQYWRREATVNAKEFADAFRSLKDRIFKNKEGRYEYGHGTKSNTK